MRSGTLRLKHLNPGLRRDDGEHLAGGSSPISVTPAKAGAQTRLKDYAKVSLLRKIDV